MVVDSQLCLIYPGGFITSAGRTGDHPRLYHHALVTSRDVPHRGQAARANKRLRSRWQCEHWGKPRGESAITSKRLSRPSATTSHQKATWKPMNGALSA